LRVPELVDIIRLLDGCDPVGADLVEVAQAHDPSGRTAIAASWIVREMILTFWGKR
jgi:arginase family enzyme